MDGLKEEFEKRVQEGKVVFFRSTKEIISEEGFNFELAYCKTLVHRFKVERSTPATSKPFNPFLPPDPLTFIAPVAPHHNLLFNKYCIAPMHLLITTMEYEPQEDLLKLADFQAVCNTLEFYAEYEWLVFYNCGKLSGASQPHKHIQMFPISAHLFDVPSLFPENHILIKQDTNGLAESCYQAYMHLVRDLPSGTSMNVLFTKNWLLVIPRKQDVIGGCWKPNSVLFAGTKHTH